MVLRVSRDGTRLVVLLQSAKDILESFTTWDGPITYLCLLVTLVIVGFAALRTEGFKSEMTLTAEKKIRKIGEVTLSSEQTIEEARAYYNELTPEDKERVNNLDVLQNAEETYQTLAYQAAAAAFDDKVNSLGEITLSSGYKIDDLFSEYYKISPLVMQYVTTSEKLFKAKETYDALKEENDYQIVVKAMSDKRYEDAIDAAYDYLTDNLFSNRYEEVVGIRVDAYIALTEQYESDEKYEKALKTAKECLEIASGDAKNKAEAKYDALMAFIEEMRPANGETFENSCVGGYCVLEVVNNGEDALVKLEDVSDPAGKVLVLYVRAGETARVNVKDGEYTFKYASGETWYGMAEYFGEKTDFYKAMSNLEFSTSYGGGNVYYHEQQITIAPVDGGNMGSLGISEDSF